MELLIDRVIVTDEQVEIRYVIPTDPSSEQVRFCHLRSDYLDGLITNDKFCFTRHDHLKLRPPRRGYPSREDASRGGDRETKMDRSSHHEGSQRCRSALGSGISTPAPVGGSGAAGGPDGGGE